MQVQSSIIEETIEIINYKGEVALSIPFRVNLAQAYDAIVEKRNNYTKALHGNDLEALGVATVDFFTAVFGEDATAKLVEFYKDDYTAMLADMAPYFSEIIYPAMHRQRESMIALKKREKR